MLLCRLLSYQLEKGGQPVLQRLMVGKAVLLLVGAVLAIWLGSFPDGDAPAAIVTGMVLVAAMAIQNTMERIHLGSFPPTTLMTGTTTQIMVDLADLLHGVSGDPRAALTRCAGSSPPWSASPSAARRRRCSS